MLPKLVVFDMGGTTVYDENYLSLAVIQALRPYGVYCLFEDILPVMGLSIPDAIVRILKDQGDDRYEDRHFVSRVHSAFVNEAMTLYSTESQVREILGATKLFRHLRSNGVRVALDAGLERCVVDVVLKRLGWDSGILDCSVTSDEVDRGRPSPDMIIRAMELTDISDARYVAKVGDTPNDMRQGLDAGCQWIVGLSEGNYAEGVLRKAGATHVIPNINYLIEEVFESQTVGSR